MNTELIDEFYLLQQSRSNEKYQDILDERVYSPIRHANKNVNTWVSKRGKMLMNLEAKVQLSMRKFKKKYLKF
jgi:hypothetical protein